MKDKLVRAIGAMEAVGSLNYLIIKWFGEDAELLCRASPAAASADCITLGLTALWATRRRRQPSSRSTEAIPMRVTLTLRML